MLDSCTTWYSLQRDVLVRPLLLPRIVIHRRRVDQAARLFRAGAPSGAEGDGIARKQHQLARRLCSSRRSQDAGDLSAARFCSREACPPCRGASEGAGRS